MDERRQEIGRQIRRLRQQRGMTQEQLAEKTGYHPTHIANIERGRAMPSLDAMLLIADALRVPAAFLLPERDRGESQPDISRLREQALSLVARCNAEQLSVLVRLIRLFKVC